MSFSSTISITARVDREEAPAITVAVEMAAQAMKMAAEACPSITLRFEDPASPTDRANVPHVYLTTLLPALDVTAGSLDDVERHWTRYLADLGETGATILLCNIFRHVRDRVLADGSAPLLGKIRELNLLAVTLSHRLGIHVADVDREMANIGARRLISDYRQRSAIGSDAAGYAIAQCLLRGGFDAVVDPAILEAAQHHLGNFTSLPVLLDERDRQRRAPAAAHG